MILRSVMEAQDDQLSVEAAGRIAGVSPRTVRSWIVHGKLPAVGGQRGKLVRLGDVLALAGANGDNGSPWGDRAETDVAVAEPPRTDAAIDPILAELRDGVIWPLAERLEVLARENGRLVAERDAAVRAREEMNAGFGSDNRFVDRLVELLQAELDDAHKRIAELEAEVARATAPVEPEEPAEPAPITRGLGRRRIGLPDPALVMDGVGPLLLSAESDGAPEPLEPPVERPWWKAWRGR
jgi:hypothetical protein